MGFEKIEEMLNEGLIVLLNLKGREVVIIFQDYWLNIKYEGLYVGV